MKIFSFLDNRHFCEAKRVKYGGLHYGFGIPPIFWIWISDYRQNDLIGGIKIQFILTLKKTLLDIAKLKIIKKRIKRN